MFARLRLQRLADALSSRYVVVEREVLHRSPVRLTPFAPNGQIDATALAEFLAAAYRDAGITREAIDTGAVILTGAALERENARRVAELFAAEGGRFVQAAAGPRMEAILAAHGSGAVARSRAEGTRILHLDVGGGTTKLALVERGEIIATSAIAVGARLVAFDERGRLARLEPAGRAFADAAVGDALDPGRRAGVARAMASAIAAAARGTRLDPPLQLLDPLPPPGVLAQVTLSGGVAEYVAGRERTDHDDLGRELAAALAATSFPAPLAAAPEGIRATVIGASQFTVQVSGSTIALGAASLPLRNVPVVPLGAPVEGEGAVALAVRWSGDPEHARIRALAERIAAATDRRPLVVATDADIAATLGAVLRDELGVSGVIALDSLDLGELDYVDVGAPLAPSGVVPVIVKSLVFLAEPSARG